MARLFPTAMASSCESNVARPRPPLSLNRLAVSDRYDVDVMSSHGLSLLANFAKALARATDAPDDYPSWSGATYEQNMAELWALWRQIRPHLSDDRQAELVEQTLLQMRRAFDSGDKQGGRDAIWSLRLLCMRGLH